MWQQVVKWLHYNSLLVAVVSFAGFFVVFALRGVGVEVSLWAAVSLLLVAIAAFYYHAYVRRWRTEDRLGLPRWASAELPKLAYTRRQKWLFALVSLSVCAVGAGVVALYPGSLWFLMGVGWFVIIVTLTLIQRRLNRERLSADVETAC